MRIAIYSVWWKEVKEILVCGKCVVFFAFHWWIGKVMQRIHKSIILLKGWALLSKLWCLLSTMTRVYYRWLKLQKGLQWNTLTLQILILVNSFENFEFLLFMMRPWRSNDIYFLKDPTQYTWWCHRRVFHEKNS